jgi:uncharacterized protein YciI
MMLFAILCLDKDGAKDLRMKIRPRHLEWLKINLPTGAFVGPLLSENGKDFRGSLYILEFVRLEEANVWLADEPYYQAELFKSVMIYPTRNILPMN